MRQIIEPMEQAEDQLALDEALLLEAEDGGDETLRVWEFLTPTVVVGRSSRASREVDLERCRRAGISVLRRCSGGAAVVGGPGCLMYSLVISFTRHPGLQRIDVAHRFVMQGVLAAIGRQVPQVRWQGICDLTWNDRKFSGNSLRIGRQHLLYHGTVLYDADLELISRCLLEAPRQPDYRAGRRHRDFITNLLIEPTQLAADLGEQFGAEIDAEYRLPRARMRSLRQQRYDQTAWNLRH